MNVLLSFNDYVISNPLKRVAKGAFHYTMLLAQPFGLARPVVDFLKRYFIKWKSLVR